MSFLPTPIRRFARTAALAACVAFVGAGEPDRTPAPRAEQAKAFAPIEGEALHNAHRVTDKVLSGAQPEGEASFRKLKDLGVKTIISVDGARPDVELARKYGLRYVHLPIGYDDVTEQEGKALAKAIAELPGPVYVHCHHGRHRSAAAVAVGCVLAGELEPRQAESVLETFGTGKNYRGLWVAARSAKPMEKEAMEGFRVEFVETAEIPPLAEAMVRVDQTWEHLKQSEKAGWLPPADHPDLDPPHEALQLREQFRELLRTDEVRAKPEAFRRTLADSERAAGALHQTLSALKKDRAARPGIDAPPAVAEAFKTIGTSCAACHKSYRD